MKSEYYKVTPIDPENLPDGEVMCWNENSFQTAYGEIHLSELEDSELVFCQNVCVTHYLQPVEPQAIDVLDELRHYCKEGRDYKMGIDTDFEQGQVLALKVVIEKIDDLRNACAMTEGRGNFKKEVQLMHQTQIARYYNNGESEDVKNVRNEFIQELESLIAKIK